MKPTEQQIETARRMRELGLGLGAKEMIYFHHTGYVPEENRFSGGDFFFFSIYKHPLEYRVDEKVGPLPTASECWNEISNHTPEVVFYVVSVMEDEGLEEDLDEAFRQALIKLKETK